MNAGWPLPLAVPGCAAVLPLAKNVSKKACEPPSSHTAPGALLQQKSLKGSTGLCTLSRHIAQCLRNLLNPLVHGHLLTFEYTASHYFHPHCHHPPLPLPTNPISIPTHPHRTHF